SRWWAPPSARMLGFSAFRQGSPKKTNRQPRVCNAAANRFPSLLLIPGAGSKPACQILQAPRSRRCRRSGWLLSRLLLWRLLSRSLLGFRLLLGRFLGRRLL